MDVLHSTVLDHSDAEDTAVVPNAVAGSAAPGKPKGRWLMLFATAVACLVVGAAIGAVVADDGAQVADLEAEVESAAAEIEHLEDGLDDAEEREAVQADVLAQCRDAAGLSLRLIAAVDEFVVDGTRLNLTPVGSSQEAEALARLDSLFLDVLGASAAMEEPVVQCAGEDIRGPDAGPLS